MNLQHFFGKRSKFASKEEGEKSFNDLKLKLFRILIEVQSATPQDSNEKLIKSEDMEQRISGCCFTKNLSMNLKVSKIKSLPGGAYVRLLNNNQAILNIEKIENFCTMWSTLNFPFRAPTNQQKTAIYIKFW